MDNRLAIYIFFILILQSTLTTQSYSSSNDNKWFYKFTYTKNINSQISIDCENNDQIWIGWSHYGTRGSINNNNNNLNSDLASINKVYNSNDQLFPMENDCWMNFTEKIAEQCNGADHCELSSQPTFIHKCGKISDYLYVSYKCIKEADTFDICKSTVKIFSQEKMQHEQQSFYIKSSEFPVEYSSSLDCSCLISSSNQQILKYEVLWFSLQDNDYLNIFNKNVTGWINPTYEMPIINKNNMIRFMTDDALAYKGFWLKISNRKACKDDWQLVGDNCVKVFSDPLDWRSANQKCQLMNGNLLKIDDVVNDLKLTQYMKSFYPEINSYWIGLRKYLDQHNKEKWMWSNNSTIYNDVSWWPWRRVNQTNQQQQDDSFTTLNKFSINNCVVKRRNEDGYFTTSCDPSIKNSFICQTSTIYPSLSLKQKSDVRLQCGQTSEIEAELKSIEAKSIITKSTQTTTTSTTAQAIIKSNSINNIVLPNLNKQKDKAIIKSTHIFSLSSSKTTKTSTNSQLINENVLINKSNEYKLNTTILAGIIAGIGMVIVIINLGVLFICRRNLKKFLKSTKQSSNQTKDDMIQEYFEAFNTLHQNNNKGGIGKPAIQSIQQVRTSSMSSGDDSLLGQHESAQLFYNPQHHLNRELTIRQSQSAFKPFARDDQLLVQQLIQQQNQYDKINHHNLLVLNQSKNILINNESTDQYAHTYECLDSIDMSNRRQAAIHNMSRNYRSNLNNSKNDSNLLQQSAYDMNNEMNSGINLSTSSGSSSSGASSTHQFIKSSSNNLPENNKFIIQQLQNTTQLVTLNDLKQFNHVIINDPNNQSSTAALLCNLVNGDLVINGSWSPDSAYYSSIPTLTTATNNYNSFNLPQQQHIVNNSTFNPNHDEMRSQIV